MRFYTIQPPASLSRYVLMFWELESDASAERPYIHRSMADGCAELIFHYKGRFDELLADNRVEKSFISGIHGQSRKYSRFITCESFGIFGAYLYPFALPALFSIPASEVSDYMPDLSSIFGREGNNLEYRIITAPDNTSRANILASFLESKLANNRTTQPPVFSAVHHIIWARGLVNIEKLAAQYFLSTRQFERNFKLSAGFSPKLYARIIRFQAAMANYGNVGKSLTEVAYECGYYDQSHFIHDFKEFSGHHPGYYFSGKAEGTEWKAR